MRFLNEYIIIIITLIIVLLIEFWSNRELNNSIDYVENMMQSIENKIEEEKMEEVKKDFFQLEKNWDDEAGTLAFFAEHNELEKVNNSLVKIKANLKTEEKNMLMENIEELKFILAHIKGKNQLKLKNIF